MDTKLAYSIIAFIQDRAASLAAQQALPTLKVIDGRSLIRQLEDPRIDTPEKLAFDFSALLDLLDLTGLLEQPDPIGTIFGTFVDRAGESIRRLIEAKHPAARRAAIEGLFEWDSARDLRGLVNTIGPFIERQFSIALSFATTLKNLGEPMLWKGIPEAYLSYFFGEHGFVTVDGIPILPPMHFGASIPTDPVTLAVELDKVKGLLAEKTADRYVRDLIRVTVEAAEDARYGLRTRYTRLLAEIGKVQQPKAIRWFKGISSLAEALVTSAVEEVVLGIAQFETNALIAASAGTYAGTAARKAAQHVFLGELGV
jgi:hypothetical protein